MLVTSKKRLLWASGISGLLLLFVLFRTGTFFNSDVPFGGLLYAIAILLCGTAAFLGGFRWKLSEKGKKRFGMLYLFLAPIGSILMVECLGYSFFQEFKLFVYPVNYLFYLLIYGIFYAVSNRIRIAAILANSLLFIFGVINHYVLLFRGTPFVPLDFVGSSTAMNVAGNYNFMPDAQMIIGSLLFINLILLACKVTYVHRRRMLVIARSCSTVAVTIMLMTVFYNTDVFEDLNIKPYLWNQKLGYQQQGAAVSFWLNTKYLLISEPNSYSADKAEEIANATTDALQSHRVGETEEDQVKPNIIAIMNETWSDMQYVGDFETNQDYMPYIRSLEENTIKGNLFVSVFGGFTSNSEFEFLTGNTMAFLPTGCNSYEQYIRKHTQSLVTVLGEQGYSKVSLHPYRSTGWNRINVYPYLGFDESYFIDDFETENRMRSFVSDRDNYAKLIELYEQKDADTPFFMLNVTMQNHGGYDKQYDNFEETVTLPWDTDGEFPKTQQYLSLMKETDDAFQELVEYFSGVDEPTIIVMFGDHQGNIEDEFYEQLYGKELGELTQEELQRRYVTPFVIWANYDIDTPDEEISMMSANYLSSYLLQVAGLEMTPYNQYLLSLYEELPVINAIGYVDKDGNHYTYNDESPYQQLLEEYQILQYNNMFDDDGKVDSIFSISDTPFYTTPEEDIYGPMPDAG